MGDTARRTVKPVRVTGEMSGSERVNTPRRTYVPAFNFCEYRARAYNPVLGRFMSEDPRLFDAGDYNLSVIATMIRST